MTDEKPAAEEAAPEQPAEEAAPEQPAEEAATEAADDDSLIESIVEIPPFNWLIGKRS